MTPKPHSDIQSPALKTQQRKLVVDVAPLFEYQWTGIPVFTRRLVQALLATDRIDVEFMFRLTHIPSNQVMAAIRAGTGAFLRDVFERTAPDIARAASVQHRILWPSVKDGFGIAMGEASTIHDMTTLLTPEFHVPMNIAYHLDPLARSIATDEVTFCISEATRAALLSAFPSAAKQLRLLPQYVDWPNSFPLMMRNLPKLKLGRYAVVVGTHEPRKNLNLLLQALKTPEVRRSELRFVIIGGRGWKMDEFAVVDISDEDKARVMFAGFTTEFTKYRLLHGAEFLILPSIHEGFGIPGLEALSLGKPVLASWSSSHPEVIGDAGVWFDPLSVTDFAAGFATIDHPIKLAELGERARKQCKKFTWQRMAKPVIDWIYDK